MLFHEPRSNQCARGQIQIRSRQCGEHGRIALRLGLAFQEDWSQVTRISDCLKRRFVSGFVRFKSKGNDIVRQRGRHKSEQLV
jgi:hypothetical protein